MTLDEIRKILRSFRTTQARVSYLKQQAEDIRKAIFAENSPAMQAIHGQHYDFTPSRGAPSSVQERLCLKELETPDAERWQKELRTLEAEIRKAESDAKFVDIWLTGLTEKERTVLTAHEIDLMSWTEMEINSVKLLGEYYSTSGLQKINARALQRIQIITQ